jgi:hypothetical protein
MLHSVGNNSVSRVVSGESESLRLLKRLTIFSVTTCVFAGLSDPESGESSFISRFDLLSNQSIRNLLNHMALQSPEWSKEAGTAAEITTPS